MRRVEDRIAPLGDAEYPPLQYMAQGAVTATDDGWLLAEHIAALGAHVVGLRRPSHSKTSPRWD